MGNSSEKQTFWPQYPRPCADCECNEFRPRVSSQNCISCEHPKKNHQGSLKQCKNCDGKGNQTIACPPTQECKQCFGRGWIGFVITRKREFQYSCAEITCKKAIKDFGTADIAKRVAGHFWPVCSGCGGLYSSCPTCTSEWAFFDNGFIPCVKCKGLGTRVVKCIYCVEGQVYCM
jgi:hypothetical protein